MKFKSTCIVLFLISMNVSRAAETTFDYPELSVVPRASERLESEAAKERNSGWKTHLPFLVPATTTFISGLALMVNGTQSDVRFNDTSSKSAPYVGMGVGLAWWAVSVGILDRLDYYSEGASDAAKASGGSQRAQLTKERRAEEALYRAGSLARKLKWISVASNLGASIFMIDAAKQNSYGKYFAIASAVTALTPLLFSHSWVINENTHRDYKKRIYAPVATLLPNPSQSSFSPGLLLALDF